jgi:hypothetical protein
LVCGHASITVAPAAFIRPPRAGLARLTLRQRSISNSGSGTGSGSLK